LEQAEAKVDEKQVQQQKEQQEQVAAAAAQAKKVEKAEKEQDQAEAKFEKEKAEAETAKAKAEQELKEAQAQKKKIEEETRTSREMWLVLVHAPIRNCKMPLCKIPGLREVICTCLKDGVEPGGGIRSKDGKCALTVDQYAEVLAEGVPLLSRKKAYEVSCRLFLKVLWQTLLARPSWLALSKVLLRSTMSG